MKTKLHPVHPGEVLLEEFLKPMNLSQNRLALGIGVPARRINEIVLGKRRVSADTALRLAMFFSMSAEFWLGLQSQYDLDITADALGGEAGAGSQEVCQHLCPEGLQNLDAVACTGIWGRSWPAVSSYLISERWTPTMPAWYVSIT